MFDIAKRFLVGRKLGSDRLGETLLPKWIALPVFCSDPLSSVAYATEEILLVLTLGGLALLGLTWWVGAAIVLLLVVVIVSYRQTCHAYPTGGGAYAVSRANLGRDAALVAASALLVDYVLTVAASVVAGVANVASAFPALARHAVPVSVVLVVLLRLASRRVGAVHHGRAGGDDVRRADLAGAGRARAHRRGPVPAGGRAGRVPAADRDRPAGHRRVRPLGAVLRHPGVHRGHPGAGREHRV